MTTFSHLEEGTAEASWMHGGELDRLTPFVFTGHAVYENSGAEDGGVVDHLIVVAAHPDDETLGAAGLMHSAAQRGATVSVVVCTDGEASHPTSPTHTRAQLAAIRRGEVVAAVAQVAPRARLHFLALPDGGLREHATLVEEGIAAVLGVRSGDTESATTTHENTLIVSPWSGDRHRDHRVAAECAARVASARGIAHYGYPIWLWHWGSATDVPWEHARRVDLDGAAREAKQQALAEHRSQTEALSDAPGNEPIISPSMAAHFDRDFEVLIEEPAINTAINTAVNTAVTTAINTAEHSARGDTMPARWFDDFYARHEDPWGFDSRWYEQRKRALLLAALPSSGLGDVLEVGCSTGHVTRELARRARRVWALDASETALHRARERERLLDGRASKHAGEVSASAPIEWQRALVPGDWPGGTFDTIVLSEVGYYLSVDDLGRLVTLAQQSLKKDGVVVACHWRHPVAEYPLRGDDVHRALRGVDAWHRLVLHEEEDFVLEVFSSRADSVARQGGLR